MAFSETARPVEPSNPPSKPGAELKEKEVAPIKLVESDKKRALDDPEKVS